MPKHLVIVESPAKARTIERYLGEDYKVLASYGHVRDLPENPGKGKFGVDVDHDFAPDYVVPDDRRKQVADIEKAARSAVDVWLATDLDREGEAIAWHVAEAAHIPAAKTRRVTFNEITEGAIRDAFASPRAIDANLVDAQQARRIVDRLVGYTLSPLLSRKVRRGLSAGRVQSVALRLVVDREREIGAFTAREYWTLEVLLRSAAGDTFTADVIRINGKTVEVGDGETAAGHAEALRGLRPEVDSLATKPSKRNPVTAVHHQHAPAGGQPQARLQPQAHHVGRPAPVRGRGHSRRPRRPHHLHANRFHRDRRRGDGGGAGRHQVPVRRQVRDRQGPHLQDEDQGRPGGARVDPADLVQARPGLDAGAPQARRAEALPADLAARDRVADGAQGARDDHGRADRRGVPPQGVGHPDAVRWLRPRLHRGPGRRRRGGRAQPAAAARRRHHVGRVRHARPALHGAAAAVHGGDPDQGARGARHRPPIHVRGHHLDHRGSRLRQGGAAAALSGGDRRHRHRLPGRALRASTWTSRSRRAWRKGWTRSPAARASGCRSCATSSARSRSWWT